MKKQLRLVGLAVSFGSLLFWGITAHAGPGGLDNSFSEDGKVYTQFLRGPDSANAVALQSDGKIVVVGRANISNFNFAIARYFSDGSLDTTFGVGGADGDGKVTTDFSGRDDEATAVVVLSDGKIIVAGYAYSGISNDFALAKYNADGSLDTTFGALRNGKVTTPVGALGNADDRVYAMAIDPDGKILLAGYAENAVDIDFALVRFDSNGWLDRTFNGTGKVTTDFASGDDMGMDIQIQTDSKILVAGTASWADLNFAIARYNTNGSLDTTFGPWGNGKVITKIISDRDDIATSIKIYAQKIILGGYTDVDPSGLYDSDFALASYNIANGSIDTAFGSNGKVITAFGTPTDQINSMAIQTDGKILAAGQSGGDFALARYLANGTLDVDFDSDGKVTTDLGGADDVANDIVIQSDGMKAVAVGMARQSGISNFALARYILNEPPAEDRGAVEAPVAGPVAGESPGAEGLVAGEGPAEEGTLEERGLVSSQPPETWGDTTSQGGEDTAQPQRSSGGCSISTGTPPEWNEWLPMFMIGAILIILVRKKAGRSKNC